MENITPENTSDTLGIQLGSPDAPVVVKEYVNLRCPYCRQWFDESKETYKELIAEGRVRRVIKLFDKEKFGLHYANVMHRYVPQDATYDETVSILESIYHSQLEWGPMDREESQAFVEDYAVNTLGLTPVANEEMLANIVLETTQAGIRFIPTMIVNEQIFDQKISQADFRHLLTK